MLPSRHTAPVAPLLTFPPSENLPPIDHSPLPSSHSSFSTSYKSNRSPRSRLYRTVALIPLVFIYCLLAFSFYAFFYSLCIRYLLFQRHRILKSTFLAISYLWLLFGCGMSLWMAYWRGGGIDAGESSVVPGAEGEDLNASSGRRWEEDEEEVIRGKGDRMEDRRHDRASLNGDRRTGGFQGEEEGLEHESLLANERGGSIEDSERSTNNEGDRRSDRRRIRAMQVKSDGTERFCRKCNISKPDRAHHCSSCRRCVLKMDHHCPWLGGGCVGWANYKFFILFLLHTGLLGIFIGIFGFGELVNFVDDVPDGFEYAPISWALAALLGCIFGGATGMFGLYHVYLAANNRTTIEAMESPTTFVSTLPPPHLLRKPLTNNSEERPISRSVLIRQFNSRLTPKQKLRLSRAKRKYNVYDLGWRENLRNVFEIRKKEREGLRERNWDREGGGARGVKGKLRVWEWVLPWGWPLGDGITFPINADHLAKLEEVAQEVYAEVEAEERERVRLRSGNGVEGRSRNGGARWESENTREGGYGREEEEDEAVSEDDLPLRRA